MTHRPVNILLCLLVSISLMLVISGCENGDSNGAPLPETDVPVADETPDAAVSDEPVSDEALIDQITGARYTPGGDDVVLEYCFDDIIRQTGGLFVFPGVSWDDDFSGLAEHFGVTAMPYYPESDPELWLRISAGDFEIMAIPYFSDNTALNGTKQCQIMVEEKYFEQADMQAAFDALLEMASSSLGEPVEDILDSPDEKMLFWRWQTESDGGLNRLELYTESDNSTGELTGFGIQLINK